MVLKRLVRRAGRRRPGARRHPRLGGQPGRAQQRAHRAEWPRAGGGDPRGARQRAASSPRDVGYVEAHGTGTSLGDPIEVAGARRGRSARRTAGASRSLVGLGQDEHRPPRGGGRRRRAHQGGARAAARRDPAAPAPGRAEPAHRVGGPSRSTCPRADAVAASDAAARRRASAPSASAAPTRTWCWRRRRRPRRRAGGVGSCTVLTLRRGRTPRLRALAARWASTWRRGRTSSWPTCASPRMSDAGAFEHRAAWSCSPCRRRARPGASLGAGGTAGRTQHRAGDRTPAWRSCSRDKDRSTWGWAESSTRRSRCSGRHLADATRASRGSRPAAAGGSDAEGRDSLGRDGLHAAGTVCRGVRARRELWRSWGIEPASAGAQRRRVRGGVRGGGVRPARICS